MDEVHLAENFKEELTCSVCMDYFRHPVTLSCGHNFCRICLLRSWGEDDRPCPCPLCRRPFHMRDIELNHRLGKLASIGRSLRPYFLQIKEEKVTCEKHEEEKTLFCKKDKSFLCVYCFQSQEHEDHMVHNVKEAAEDSREKIQIWRESLAAEYGAFHKLLEKEEKVHFHTMNKQESDNLKIVRQSVITVSQQLHSLREVILDMEQCSWKTSSQLLKVVGGTLNRCEFLLGHRPEVITTSGIMFQKTIMWEMLKSFKVTLTLDPKNISPYLILSDDLRTVIRRSNQQNTPFSTNQDENNFILGDQIFTTGIHYWEVEDMDEAHLAENIKEEPTPSNPVTPSNLELWS
ncbi:probable E3 ubiquitin-protein ligase TRIML1 [Sarcophilus harrisii]|uniref:probable E3 ubiquitin-protein ligase TRIML1 n=1 Tax=Sarcophilus harrisii TaxID=9305 RepID=UPI001301B118|nr:probable E3 ubiquitin-protein ligase TRIML1 [Sarcophilus harrisii]